jgi:hypothetical protein
MTEFNEPTNLGLSEECHIKLKLLSQEKYFNQMADCFRFAVAYSLSKGISPPEIRGSRQNIFGVSTIDPLREVYDAVVAIGYNSQPSVYREIEKLAEWGINELYQMHLGGKLDVIAVLNEAQDSRN